MPILFVFAIIAIFVMVKSKHKNSNKVKYNEMQWEAIRLRVKQLHESVDLVNTTVKPDVFFRRLGFTLDCLLDLMNYDQSVFKGDPPEKDYAYILGDLENIVNSFIERSYNKNLEDAMQLKTDRGKQNRMEKYFNAMYCAFEEPHEFWQGSNLGPHYTGILYTQANLDKLHQLEKNCPYINNSIAVK